MRLNKAAKILTLYTYIDKTSLYLRYNLGTTNVMGVVNKGLA